jgi:predicted nuclease with TOPRIM domain
MSGFAFSHQFSKRWLATPTPVKHAIIQELDDIVTLLYPDTDLDGYQFSVPNLHDKVEELLAIERDHQEKLQAQARERELEEQNAVLQGQVHELYTRVKDLEYELGLAQDAIGLAAKMGFR